MDWLVAALRENPALTTTPLDVKFSRLRLVLGFDFGR